MFKDYVLTKNIILHWMQVIRFSHVDKNLIADLIAEWLTT